MLHNIQAPLIINLIPKKLALKDKAVLAVTRGVAEEYWRCLKAPWYLANSKYYSEEYLENLGLKM